MASGYQRALGCHRQPFVKSGFATATNTFLTMHLNEIRLITAYSTEGKMP
jgi:hypothetical protein